MYIYVKLSFQFSDFQHAIAYVLANKPHLKKYKIWEKYTLDTYKNHSKKTITLEYENPTTQYTYLLNTFNLRVIASANKQSKYNIFLKLFKTLLYFEN